MRKRKSLKKADDESDASEPGAEPEEFQDSGEDWTPDADTVEQPARGGRKRAPRASFNNSKKKRKNSTTEESEDEAEEDEEGEDEEGELDEEEGSDEEKNGSDGNKSDSSQSKDIPKHFHSGNFVLLKSDVKWDGDTVISKLDELNLWKIDGKALLQKFIPMESEGKILHKCTCVYSGWNVDNRDNYYPITEILDRNPRTDSKEICVALDLNDLIKVRDNFVTDCAICLQKCHHPTQLPCNHIFCFLCVKGIAILSKKCAICRSQIPPDYFDHPMLLENLMTEEILAPESEKYHWYYEGRNGWWKYDERSNIDLENAYNSTESECLLLLAGSLYCVDFQNMVQFRRSDPTKRRKVKRDLPSLPSKGIAGIKSITRQTEDFENIVDRENTSDVTVLTNVDVDVTTDITTISVQSVHMIEDISDSLSQIDLQREMLSTDTDDFGLQDSAEEI